MDFYFQYMALGFSVVVVTVYRMEVVNLMFAIIGHVLATFLYLVRRVSNSRSKVSIDRSSILERKETLRQLWEKKMMENEECVANGEEPKSLKSSDKSEEVDGKIATSKPLTNGVVLDGNESSSTGSIKELDNKNEETSQTPEKNVAIELKLTAVEKKDESNKDIEVNKSASDSQNIDNIHNEEQVLVEQAEDSLEREDLIAQSNSNVVEENVDKVYTSTLEQTLVMSQTEQITRTEEEILEIVSTEEITQGTEIIQTESIVQREYINDSQTSMMVEGSKQDNISSLETKIYQSEKLEESSVCSEREILRSPESKTQPLEEDEEDAELLKLKDNEKMEDAETHGLDEDWRETPQGDISVDSIEIPSFGRTDEEDDAKQDLQKSLLETEYSSEISGSRNEDFLENHGFQELSFKSEEHGVTQDTERRIKLNDKMSKLHSLGVQKTEQPYSTCTTETKIAMEIREMREREEELKLMRERQALSPIQPVSPQTKTPPPPPKIQEVQKPAQRKPQSPSENLSPGYRVSSVFGHRPPSHNSNVDEEQKIYRTFSKESAVEKEIRLARDREEELRKEKGLPPREDDSYVKPSQVKSSQVKVFSKMNYSSNARLMATTKIQHEIEEQTMREMALRESGSIQTISKERTDAKVSKLKTLEASSPECTSPTFQNGNSSLTNGSFTNGHVSPDSSSKRSTPSPTGSHYSSTHPVSRNFLPGPPKGISMQKFIASRGKETTFASPRNGPFHPKADYLDASRSIPAPGKLKRTVSVESKIQQEIMEMKQREEELKLMHSNKTGQVTTPNENGIHNEKVANGQQEQPNGETATHEELCPRRSNLIAQWEQRIQNAEGRA